MVGAPLFKRTPRAVSLTAAGDALLPEAVRILRQVGRAQEAVRRANLASRDRLRIGTTTYGPPDQVLWAMSRLRKAASAEVELVAGEAHDLLKDLRDGEIDAAIVHTPVLATGLSPA